VLIAGLKSGSTDRQEAGIAKALAFLQIVAARRSLLLAFLMLAASFYAAAQKGTSDVSPGSPNGAVLDYASRAVHAPTAKQSAALTDENSQTTPFPDVNEPLSMVVVLDASSSMAARIDEARKVLGELIRASDALEMALVVIHDEPQVVVHRGGSAGQIERAAETVQGDGFGGMWDGMYLGMRELQDSRCPRKAVIVFSDDGDKYSRHSPYELMSLLKKTDVQVYVLGMFDRYANRFQARMQALQLDEITSVTGGRMLPGNDFSTAAAQIAYALCHLTHRHAPSGQ